MMYFEPSLEFLYTEIDCANIFKAKTRAKDKTQSILNITICLGKRAAKNSF